MASERRIQETDLVASFDGNWSLFEITVIITAPIVTNFDKWRGYEARDDVPTIPASDAVASGSQQLIRAEPWSEV